MTERKRWLPLDFPLPKGKEPGRWKLRPLGTSELLRDYSAIMSSIDSQVLTEDTYFSLTVEAEDEDAGEFLVFSDDTSLFDINPVEILKRF